MTLAPLALANKLLRTARPMPSRHAGHARLFQVCLFNLCSLPNERDLGSVPISNENSSGDANLKPKAQALKIQLSFMLYACLVDT